MIGCGWHVVQQCLTQLGLTNYSLLEAWLVHCVTLLLQKAQKQVLNLSLKEKRNVMEVGLRVVMGSINTVCVL